SLHYLKHLTVDFIKIDGSFVRSLHEDDASRVFVRSMADLARGLGIACIAEFVENAAIVDELRALGVPFGQGHHLGRPTATLPHQPANAGREREPE
ncbi:EAL domain-containing protein, partial [Thiohalobacter sp.]|uniref:EAL domain-containing protein n=1 Tax=Thiohalobacter sp. TaxID=2025948 RepID=UPI002606A295